MRFHLVVFSTSFQTSQNMGKNQKNSATGYVKCCVAFTWTRILLVEQIKQNKKLSNASFIADSKESFRKYKGVEVLIEVFKEHKNVAVTKALTHVLTGNNKN